MPQSVPAEVGRNVGECLKREMTDSDMAFRAFLLSVPVDSNPRRDHDLDRRLSRDENN